MDIQEYFEFLSNHSLTSHIFVSQPEQDLIIEVEVNGTVSRIRITQEAVANIEVKLRGLAETVGKYKFLWEPILNALTKKR